MKPLLDCIVGARPNMMKMAPLSRALGGLNCFRLRLVHTGQHYDYNMSEVFLQELGLPEPDVNLNCGAGNLSQDEQTAAIIAAYGAFLDREEPPRGLIVVGDVTSTLACSLVAAKRGIPVAHVEAGLRSFDWDMPEEINRIVCDRLAQVHLVSEDSGLVNLAREGLPPEGVHFTGNIMIDNLVAMLPKAEQSDALERLGVSSKGYVLLTLHRPSNVDDPSILRRLMDVIAEIGGETPVVFAAHPRTVKRLEEFGLDPDSERIKIVEPLGYPDTLQLMRHAVAVLTDSGGMQEETAVLDVPCLTLRRNTERPITTVLGTSELVGNDADSIREAWRRVRSGGWRRAQPIPLWDGKAAQRMADVLRQVWRR